jgi:uncharacterized protein YjbJ (UPF0337 family)
MNRDQIMGIAKDVVGKVQQKIGEWTGNSSQQAQGAAKQIEGKVQRTVGNTEHALSVASRRTVGDKAELGSRRVTSRHVRRQGLIS